MRYDNFLEIWLYFFQKQAETHQLCHESALFLQTEQNKCLDNQKNISVSRELQRHSHEQQESLTIIGIFIIKSVSVIKSQIEGFL